MHDLIEPWSVLPCGSDLVRAGRCGIASRRRWRWCQGWFRRPYRRRGGCRWAVVGHAAALIIGVIGTMDADMVAEAVSLASTESKDVPGRTASQAPRCRVLLIDGVPFACIAGLSACRQPRWGPMMPGHR